MTCMAASTLQGCGAIFMFVLHQLRWDEAYVFDRCWCNHSQCSASRVHHLLRTRWDYSSTKYMYAAMELYHCTSTESFAFMRHQQQVYQASSTQWVDTIKLPILTWTHVLKNSGAKCQFGNRIATILQALQKTAMTWPAPQVHPVHAECKLDSMCMLCSPCSRPVLLVFTTLQV